MPRNPNARKCTGTSKQTGQRCKSWARPGALVCNLHGGAAPQVAQKALVRVEFESWGLNDATIDPGEALLRLLTQAYHRANRYAADIAEKVEREGGLEAAMVGESLILNPNTGNLTKVGEYIRGLASLENAERDRAAKFAALAIQAGLAERQVKLAERQGALIEQVLLAAFEAIGLSAEQRKAAPEAIRRALSAVA